MLASAAVLNAGHSHMVGGQQIHHFCASHLEEVNNVAARTMSGMAQAGIAGASSR